MRKNPKLSIIIPTYNEEKNIENAILSIKKQSYKNYEIIIVDDGSFDKTVEIIKSYKKIKLFKQSHKGPGEARNLGARHAKGEILIFVDADMTFDKDYLKYLIQPIINEEAIGTEEETQIAKNAEHNIWSKCLGKMICDPNVSERRVFRAMEKKEFLKLGGFDSSHGYADDQTFFLKYGIRPNVAEKAICYHDNPGTLKEVYKQARWVGGSIKHDILELPVLKYIVPFILYLISPIAIPIYSMKKSIAIKNFWIFIPFMIIFTIVRYFGTVQGILRNIYFNKNFR